MRDAARICCAVLLLAASPALAEDPPEPGAGGPFSIEDVKTQDVGSLELEHVLGYERSHRGRDLFEFNPSIEYGLADRLELRLGLSYGVGDASSANRGRVTPGLRWQAVEQAGLLPNIGFIASVDLPFGAGDEGLATELLAIVSRTTGRGPGSWGVHLNAAWIARPDPGEDERRQGYRFGAAVSHVATDNLSVLVGYVQEKQDRGERDLRLVEAGFERRLGEVTLGMAFGAGLNEDSPRFRITAGIKMDFQIRPR
jgi:hypothetical protein